MSEGQGDRPAPEKKRGLCWRLLGKIWTLESDKEESRNNQEDFVRQTFRELIIYGVFLCFVCIIVFTMASTDMYYYTKVMMDLFLDSDDDGKGVKFRDITTMEDFWSFALGPLMSGLFWTEWYNKKNPPPFKGLIYYENKLLGPPRLRQLRVFNQSCSVNSLFQGLIHDCYAEYDEGLEDTSYFRSPTGTDDDSHGGIIKDAWSYRTREELGGRNFWGFLGKLATYDQQGYTLDLDMVKTSTQAMLTQLKRELWLRRGSRVVFITFTVYNANINLFCVINLCVEFPATGGAEPSWSFDTVKLIRYVTKTDYFVMGCEVIFIIFIIYYTVEEVIEISSTGLIYFKDFWNLLDLLLILVAFLCAAINVYRVLNVDDVLDKYQESDRKYQNFEFLGFLESRFNNCVAGLVFFAWVKVFKYISFNKTMTQLSTTLSRCAYDLLGFLIMFAIVFMSFTMWGYLLFVSQVEDFSTFLNAFFTLFRIILGDFNFKQLQKAEPFLGPIFFMMFVFFVFFVLINMFLAIINDTYSEVKSDMAKQQDVFIMSDYLKQSVNKFMDKIVTTKEKMEGIEKYLQTESSGKTLGYEEWKTKLLKLGYDEDEIEAVFTRYDTDNDRTLDPTEQKNMLEELEKSKTLGKGKETKGKDGQVTSFGDHDVDEDSDDEAGGKKELCPLEDFEALTSRVERVEQSIASVLENIGTVRSHVSSMR